jgi:hypothetical protein
LATFTLVTADAAKIQTCASERLNYAGTDLEEFSLELAREY